MASQIFDIDLPTLSYVIIYLLGIVWEFRILNFQSSFFRHESCYLWFESLEPAAGMQLICTYAANPVHYSLSCCIPHLLES